MLILYSGDFHFSGWSTRGRLAILEKGLPYEERIVELDWPLTARSDGVLIVGDGNEDREPEAGCAAEAADLLRLDEEDALMQSPVRFLPRVPVLVDTDHGVVAWEVMAIAEHLDDVYPTAGCGPLLGTSPAERSLVRSACSWALRDLRSLINEASYGHSLRPGNERHAMPTPAREQASWVGEVVAQLLTDYGGPYLLGRFTMADVALTPVAQQFSGSRVHQGGV